MRSFLNKVLRYIKKHGFQRFMVLLLKSIIGAFRCILPYSISAQFPDRETILIVSHEASRTGAPILALNIVKALIGRYNVIVLFLDDGVILDDFRSAGATVILTPRIKEIPPLLKFSVSRLCKHFNFKFAIVNSIESRSVLPALSVRQVPTISLIHEFTSYIRPKSAFSDVFLMSDEVVFSAKITLEDAVFDSPEINEKNIKILPQGPCVIPSHGYTEKEIKDECARISNSIRSIRNRDDAFVILGAGFVQLRKGVDLFIECAAKVLKYPGGEKCHFVWVGKGYDPENDLGYSVYLADQIRRSNIQDHVSFIDETFAIEAAYDEADLFLLSSRLDPLPNVAIDALAKGLPVLCFDKTTGIADFLESSGLAGYCVAGYLDTDDMARNILELINSKNLRDSVSKKSRVSSAKYFNMELYIQQLEELALSACTRVNQNRLDVQLILDSKLFQMNFSVPQHGKHQSMEECLPGYIRSWATGLGCRKPFPGFHPGVYQEQHGVKIAGSDPFADYLSQGQPQGPWNYAVIKSGKTVNKLLPDNKKVALHLHVFYPDLLPEIISRLMINKICPDLFISIVKESDKKLVQKMLDRYIGNIVNIMVVPNCGRDIGPLITGFGKEILSNYEYVGHIHTKKTVDIKDASVGSTWYAFLLDNLLGSESDLMADNILSEMKKDTSIGMVFPDDPNAVGWTDNRMVAENLANKIGINCLPENFIFPIGTMFWARTDALAPIINLNLGWDEYPKEPIPYDGTILHAIERLFSFAAVSAGYRLATTNLFGVSR